MTPQHLPPLDPQQRYTISETTAYLRCSRAHVYALLDRDELRVLRDGRRIYIPGSEIIRRSTLPGVA